MEYRTTDEWKIILGEHIRTTRLLKNIDQREVARRSDVSVTAVKRLEAGNTSTTETLIRVLRILEKTDWLESLAPPVSINPMLMLKFRGPVRKRVYTKRKSRKT